MALRWIDGFESYGVTNGNTAVGVLNKYTNNFGTLTVRAGRLGGHALSLSGSANIVTPAFTANDTWITGFGFRYSQVASEQEILILNDGSTVQFSLTYQPNGEMRVYRGDFNHLLGTTSGARLRAGVWAYIEVKVKIHGSTGTVDVKVNGVSVLSLTSQNTDQAGTIQATKVGLVSSSAGGDLDTFDDFYVCDKSGSNNTTFLGPQKVTTLFPTSDHGTNQWTPNAGGTHYNRLTDNPNDGSTTYLSDATSGDTEEFGYASTGSEVTSIKGVQINTVFETDSGTAFSVKNHVNSGGTSSDDAGTAGTNGTYTTASRLVETDPNTSALWTKTNLDASLFGVKTA